MSPHTLHKPPPMGVPLTATSTNATTATTATTNPKATYYHRTLLRALVAGSCAGVRAYGGSTDIGWGELWRKFYKHCSGGDHERPGRIAERVHALEQQYEDVEGDDRDYQWDLDEEWVLSGRKEDVEEGYKALLADAERDDKSDTLLFALALHAYALGRPRTSLEHLQERPTHAHVLDVVPVPSGLRAPIAKGDETENTRECRIWALLESVRAVAVLGMAHEKVSSESDALAAYAGVAPLFGVVETEIVTTPAPSPHPHASFGTYRALWSWVETIVWRGVVLSARAERDVWTWLGYYATMSRCWPASFRTRHRESVGIVWVRAIRVADGWRNAIDEHRAVLSVSTRFPKAGERNWKVEEFVELCVSIWESGIGKGTGWVIDILWWASRLTFNSETVLRHLVRMLHVAGEVTMAKRALGVYVQVVMKAAETSGKTDAGSVETAVYGVRMLCGAADKALKSGIRLNAGPANDVKEAERIVALLREGKLGPIESDMLAACMDEAEGVVVVLKSVVEHSPSLLTRAHELFVKSVERYPTASGYYHLAISFTRPIPGSETHPSLEEAQMCAGKAVELDSEKARAWHLLGLISAAKGEWEAAGVAVDIAVGMTSGKSEEGEEQDRGTVEAQEQTQLLKQPKPPSLLSPPAAAATGDGFETALQVRMTQVALCEAVEGPEGAARALVGVFGWVAGVIGTGSQSGRESEADGSRIKEEAETEAGLATVEINVSPATPEVESTEAPAFGRASSERLGVVKDKLKDGAHRIKRVVGSRTSSVKDGRKSEIDFESLLGAPASSYQASSIHRRGLGSNVGSAVSLSGSGQGTPTSVSPSVSSPSVPSGQHQSQNQIQTQLVAELWLQSAAVFRRLGRIEQARGAIQEAEVRVQGHPDVWVQLGHAHYAMNRTRDAVDAYHKALVMDSECVSAVVGLGRVDADGDVRGLLEVMARGVGWDVPEVWYMLGRAKRIGRDGKGRECMKRALELSEARGDVRAVRDAVGFVGW